EVLELGEELAEPVRSDLRVLLLEDVQDEGRERVVEDDRPVRRVVVRPVVAALDADDDVPGQLQVLAELVEDLRELRCAQQLHEQALVGVPRRRELDDEAARRRLRLGSGRAGGCESGRGDEHEGQPLHASTVACSRRRRSTSASTSRRTSASKSSVGCQPSSARAFEESPTRSWSSAAPRTSDSSMCTYSSQSSPTCANASS